MQEKFDVIVIGGGPGGYVAAIRASQLKLKVALIEREHLGGICLNWGCIPTKALLKVSEIIHTCNNAEHFGIHIENLSFDIKKIVDYSRNVSKKLASGVESLMKKNNIKVFQGHAKLLGKGVVSIGNQNNATNIDQKKIEGKNIIIASGARPRELETLKVDGKFIWNYKHAMTPDSLPNKLLIVGSGAIGIEFASFYNMLGVDVTIMELAPNILPHEDIEISNYARKSFEKRGIKILTNTEVVKTSITKSLVTVNYKEADKDKLSEMQYDRVISAIGVVANTENLGLENTKVKVERGNIKTNAYMQTDEPNIYAIGDVASAPWLAHKASHEGIICAEKIAGLKVHPMNMQNIPSCTYSYPQIASVGLTEKAAREQFKDIKVGSFPLYANGKAIAIDKTDGFVKTIFHAKTGELLGAHLIGADVTEIIQGLVIAKTLEATEVELMHTIFPHPTISESMHEAVLATWGRALHL